MANSLSFPRMSSAMPDVTKIKIERKPHEGEVYDVLGGAARWEVKVHDHGLVALVDVMPRVVPVGKTADAAIARAALDDGPDIRPSMTCMRSARSTRSCAR